MMNARLPRCIVCKDLDPTIGSDEGLLIRFFDHISVKQLQESSALCPVCSIIFQGVTKYLPHWIGAHGHAEYKTTTSGWVRKEIGTLECQVIIRDPSSLNEGDVLRPQDQRGTTLLNEFIEFYTSEGQELHWKVFGRARTVPSPTFSAFEPRGLVHHWLQECFNNHTKCRMAVQQPLPTRVIDVFGNERSGGQPFLYETRGESEPYICLSYCWGGIEFLMTTLSTLEQRKTGIAWSEVPQTFADAIWVTRSLGVRYLWIDSLCIVQDDPDDWTHESAAMATVYGHSYLTIAAWEAPNAARGMFYAIDDSSDSKLSPSQVMSIPPNDTQAVVNVRRRLPHWKGETTSPLSRRAWAFQESILPKRVVRLGLYEPLWECNELSNCCCTLTPQSNNELKAKFSSLSNAENISEQKRWNMWSEIIYDYSSRALTRGTDKLVALSGIANSVKALWNCRYVAGLWETDILMGLRWQLNGFVKRKPRPHPFQAPTWSWASIDEHVSYPSSYYETREFFQVSLIDVQCELESDNPTGSVSGGHLTISGKVVEMEYIYESHSQAGLFGGSIESDSLYFRGQHTSFQADVDLTLTTNEGLPEVQEAYCLLLGAFGEQIPLPPDEPTAEPEQEWSILVLQKCSNRPNRFRRIGIINGGGKLEETWFEGVEDRTLTIE